MNRSSVQQMRRRRLKTLLRKLFLFSTDCYSDVMVIIAEYEIASPEKVTKYLIINFSAGHRPDDHERLFRTREKRKKTLMRMLQKYSSDCLCDFTATLSELGLRVGWHNKWREIRKEFLLESTHSSNTFPPSEAQLVCPHTLSWTKTLIFPAESILPSASPIHSGELRASGIDELRALRYWKTPWCWWW